jgi:TonB family protein
MKKILIVIMLIVSLQSKAQITDTIEAKKTALKIVEFQAQYEGGMKEFNNFLIKNLRYPDAMQEQGLAGKSTIEFVVCPDGSICDLNVLSSAGPLFDNEAKRVLKLMPNWRPATQKGEKVASYYSVPINYTLGDDENYYSYDLHTLMPIFYANEFVKFKVGKEKMREFIDKNINIDLPKKVVAVVLKFKVDADGNFSNIETNFAGDNVYRNEAIRILNLFPTWIPAYLDNNPIATEMKLAIVFKK